MKNIVTIVLLFGSLALSAQTKHFTLIPELRLEGDSLFCDLKVAEDYDDVVGAQFGFHHDSENSRFLEVISGSVSFGKIYNEVCPQYVRISWVEPSARGIDLKKGDAFLTLSYFLEADEDHFICMMESRGSRCTAFKREVLYGQLLEKFIVDDVCIEFSASSGNLSVHSLTTSNQQENEINAQVYYSITNRSAVVRFSEMIDDQIELFIFNLAGQPVLTEDISGREVQIPLDKLADGVYTYRLLGSRGVIKTGKLLKT